MAGIYQESWSETRSQLALPRERASTEQGGMADQHTYSNLREASPLLKFAGAT
jgi:hypothetical protein